MRFCGFLLVKGWGLAERAKVLFYFGEVAGPDLKVVSNELAIVFRDETYNCNELV